MQTMQRVAIVRVAHYLLLTSSVTLWTLSSGCYANTAEKNLVSMFVVPEMAYDVKRITLGVENNQQLFFRIRRPYPSKDILNKYNNDLKLAGWTKCVGGKESWDYHRDASTSDHLFVHQIAHYWINRSEKKLAIIAITYYSKQMGEKQQPNNDEQNVAVLVQRDVNVDKERSTLSLSCEK